MPSLADAMAQAEADKAQVIIESEKETAKPGHMGPNQDVREALLGSV